MYIRYVLSCTALALVLSACGAATATTPPANPTAAPAASAGSIQISEPWVRAVAAMGMGEAQPTGEAMGAMPTAAAMAETTPAAGGMGEMGGANGAAYMTIRNTSGEPDRLIKAQSDVAKTVELHTVIQENGVMQMRPVEAIDVPANGEAVLKPGGFHVMLIDLTRDLKPGDKVDVTLQFERAGTLKVPADVRQ
jgi:copper(I)-binding protein